MSATAITRPRRRERVLASRVDDQLMLFDVDAGTYFGLDEVGGDVWALCDGTRPVAEVVAAIGERYDAPLDVIESDVRELLAELARENLVVEAT